MKTYLLLTITLLTLFSCQKENKSRQSNILQFPLTSEVSTLDPASSYDVISARVVYQIYEQLYEYHYLKRPYTLQPLLAEGMPQIDNNGMRYTIKIKKNIRYHDHPVFKGKPRYLKAQDFITQIKRLAYKPTKSNGWWLFDGRIRGLNEFREKAGDNFQKFLNTPVQGLQAPDDHTLVIELNKPYPQMLFSLAMSFTSPVPLELVKEYQNIFDDVAVGTGPFQLKSWLKLSSLKLEKNPYYRDAFYPTQGDRQANSKGFLKDSGKKIPFLEGIHFKVIREAQTRWLNFRSKKIDILPSIPKDNYSTAINEDGKLKKDLKKENIQLAIFPTLTYWWLAFNMQDPILGKNKKLRLAIAHALDVERFIKVFTNNVGQKANSIYPPGIPGYDPSASLPYQFNLEKAKELLKEAGYPNGKGLPEFVYDVRGVSTTARQQGEMIKSQLEKIGVTINVVTNPFPTFLRKAREGKLQLWQGGWAMDYPDSENILQLLYSPNHAPGPNSTFYKNERLDQLFEELKLLSDDDRKRQIMKEAEAIVHEDLPWVMQYYTRNYALYHKYLLNYRHSDLIYNNMKYLRLQ